MSYRRLIGHTIFSLAVCAVLVVICYEFIDRPVAYWVHDHLVPNGFWFPPQADAGPWIMGAAVPVFLALLAIRWWRPWRGWELLLFAGLVSLLVTGVLKVGLKWIFGRPWAEKWIGENPSLLESRAYDFHWFDGGRVYGSFPSGHTIAICAVAAVAWIALPKLRWIAVLAVAGMMVALVTNNYHFVGDCVAGGFVGWLGGVWVARLMNIGPETIGQPRAGSSRR